MSNKEDIIERLLRQLDRADEVRRALRADDEAVLRRDRLRRWQADRLSRTHADLLASRRFGETAAFFLSDIYGPKDLSSHVQQVHRILPVMTRILPAEGLATVADAVELNALSEDLDADMVRALGARADTMLAADYGNAYRAVGRRQDRERQIELIGRIGRHLDRLTRSRLIGAALATMRKPARLADLGELQDFLERGYTAFRKMGGADEFLQKITTREKQLLEAVLAGDDSGL
jgi:hypothetical protein